MIEYELNFPDEQTKKILFNTCEVGDLYFLDHEAIMDFNKLSKTKRDITFEICAPIFGQSLFFALNKLGYKINDYKTFDKSLETIFRKANINKRQELFKKWDTMSTEEFHTNIDRLYSKTETNLSYFILYISAYIKELQKCIYEQKYFSMESIYKLSIYSARAFTFFENFLRSIKHTNGSDKTHAKRRTIKNIIKKIINDKNFVPNPKLLTDKQACEIFKKTQKIYKLEHGANLGLSEQTFIKWLIEWYPSFGLPKKFKPQI